MSICGSLVGSYSQMGKTFIFTDENGNEITGVLVDQMTIFDATDNDVREGMVYAGNEGVSTGTKNIPAYRTTQGFKLILSGAAFSINNLCDYDKYDYTSLQCIIAPYNSSGVAADKIAINDCVYPVQSIEKIADVTKNTNTKSIDLNIINDTDSIYVIYYFTYREEE